MCWWLRTCQEDPNGSPTRELEETTRASPEHHPAKSETESLQAHTQQNSRPGLEPSSVEAVYMRTPSGACQKRRRLVPEENFWGQVAFYMLGALPVVKALKEALIPGNI